MIETSTAAHLVWDALVELGRDALPGVQVVDGPHQIFEPAKDFFIVGQSDGTDPAVNVAYGDPDMLGRRREEGDIVCVVASYAGETDMKARRDRCAELLGALVDMLKQNPGLGVADAAWLGDDSAWAPMQAPDGAFCSVAFTVHYVAEI